MINAEYHKGKIKEVLETTTDIIAVIDDGEITTCAACEDCNRCIFHGSGDCGRSMLDWLLAEHTPTLEVED